MDRPRLPLGDYYQLLWKNGLLTAPAPLGADLTRRVSAVVCDSRAAVPGSLFLCKGAAFRPEYLVQALERGAFAYVSEVDYGLAPCLRVADIRAAMGLMADLAWGHPSGAVKVLGLTGTKGKTTTAYFLKSILDSWRESRGLHPAALLSSIVTDDGAQRRPAVLTTPEPLDLQRHLWNAADAGCGYVVMEASSQALKYGRMTGVELEVGAFLNLGEDHISPREHPTPEDYFQSKLKIFDRAKAAVVNLDSGRAGEVLAAAGRCGRTATYSLRDSAAQVCGGGLRKREGGTAFTLHTPWGEEELALALPGAFNVSNALCAAAVAGLLGTPLEHVRAGLAGCRVPGRMETYQKGGRTVIVDYAHNGMALDALLRAVRADFPGAPVTVVFGCVGGKALDRREGMAQAAAALADRVVLTEDDPGPEDPADICAQVGKLVAGYGGEAALIPDREEAIQTAIEDAPAPGVVVLAGKGPDQFQKRSQGPEPYAGDALLAKKYLGLPL